MSRLNILRDMQQSDQVVHVVDVSKAARLLKARLIRKVVIDPPPGSGHVAVSLTTLGKSYKRPNVESPPVVDNKVEVE